MGMRSQMSIISSILHEVQWASNVGLTYKEGKIEEEKEISYHLSLWAISVVHFDHITLLY